MAKTLGASAAVDTHRPQFVNLRALVLRKGYLALYFDRQHA